MTSHHNVCNTQLYVTSALEELSFYELINLYVTESAAQ